MRITKNLEQWDGFSICRIFIISDNTVVASCSLDIQQNDVILNAIYVQLKYRKKKLGSRLVKFAIKEFVKLDKKSLMLKVKDDWRAKWYATFGFAKMKFNRNQRGYQDGLNGYVWMKLKKPNH